MPAGQDLVSAVRRLPAPAPALSTGPAARNLDSLNAPGGVLPLVLALIAVATGRVRTDRIVTAAAALISIVFIAIGTSQITEHHRLAFMVGGEPENVDNVLGDRCFGQVLQAVE